MNIIINIVEEPVSRKHISYSVKSFDDTISLCEVEEVSYIHPDSQGMATISRIEENDICTYKKWDERAAPLFLLKHAINNIDIIYKNNK